MEVSNLLLAEQSRDDHHETRTQDHINYVAQGNTKHGGGGSGVAVEGAVYPSTTLPAIRPLHEDQLFDARPYTNEIDSLTLPEIDWQAITASIHPVETHGHVQSHVQVAAVQVGGVAAKRTGKSGAPIAEVLNQVSPVVKHAQRAEDTEEADDRKRRKIDDTTMRTLPKPAPAAKQKSTNKRHFLPPLLVPLHEPPPDAGLIPSMTTEGIRRPLDKASSREELHAEQHPQHAGCTLVASVKPIETETTKKTTANATKAAQAAKSRRARHTWNEEETSDLLRGVAKFGIGNWKKILECSEYKFQSRTAVDLKDRFRTCCPEEYRKVGSTTEKPPPLLKSPPKLAKVVQEDTTQKPRRKKSSEGPSGEKASKFEHKLPDELARLGIEGPFPKAQRRTRRGFTNEEDAAILRGFEKYGAKWTKIQSDPTLGLTSRSRTDLRDRFRNRFPNKFIETGHKFKQKDGLSRDNDEEDGSSVDIARPSSVVQTTSLQAPAVQEIGTSQQMPSLRLLTAPSDDSNFFTDFGGDITPDSDEREGPITLSRNIFDWADQNSRTHQRATSNVFELTNTITTMDQFHINPMVARHQHAPVNLFPQLPLSGILNGPVRLPSAKELVSGLEGEAGM